MIEDLLPIGSVVLLKEGKKRLMIDGIKPRTSNGDIYDYIGVLYPEGFIDNEHKFLFNHKDIEMIHFMGFVDIEHTLFRKKLSDRLKEVENS